MAIFLTRVYGTLTCDDCIRTKKLLTDYHVSYEFVDIALNEEAIQFVKDATHGELRTPVVVLENGEKLIEPSHALLIEKLGLK